MKTKKALAALLGLLGSLAAFPFFFTANLDATGPIDGRQKRIQTSNKTNTRDRLTEDKKNQSENQNWIENSLAVGGFGTGLGLSTFHGENLQRETKTAPETVKSGGKEIESGGISGEEREGGEGREERIP